MTEIHILQCAVLIKRIFRASEQLKLSMLWKFEVFIKALVNVRMCSNRLEKWVTVLEDN